MALWARMTAELPSRWRGQVERPRKKLIELLGMLSFNGDVVCLGKLIVHDRLPCSIDLRVYTSTQSGIDDDDRVYVMGPGGYLLNYLMPQIEECVNF